MSIKRGTETYSAGRCHQQTQFQQNAHGGCFKFLLLIINCSFTRISCAADYTDMVVTGLGAQQTLVTNGFFLGGAQLVFATSGPSDSVYGMSVIANTWYDSTLPPFAVNETAGKWASVTDLTVSGSLFQNNVPRNGPVASRTITWPVNGASNTMTLDFSKQLLFPSLGIALATASISGPLPQGSSQLGLPTLLLNYTSPGAATVTLVASQQPGAAFGDGVQVHVTVDQSARSG